MQSFGKKISRWYFYCTVAHEKAILVQTTNMVFMHISNQNAKEKNKSIIRGKIKKEIIIARITVFLKNL